MKALPKVARNSQNQLSNKSITPVIAGVVAGIVAGVSLPALASTSSAMPVTAVQPHQPQVNSEVTAAQRSSAVILTKPSLDGQTFAAHYSHSSHASHASHYSCTPGSTC